MRILFYADGRSPIAIQWIRYWVERGDEVHLASSFPCEPQGRLASYTCVPVAFGALKAAGSPAVQRKGWLWGAGALGLRLRLRQWLGPLTIQKAGGTLREVARRIQPQLVHALRIPYEGMVAAAAGLEAPLAISVWGNDFTLHARSSPLMAYWTGKAVRACQGLHADCRRDVRIGKKWGFHDGRPELVIPGNGGINTSIFYLPQIPVSEPVGINPRGFRGYVRNDTFFKAVGMVIREEPSARFLCPGMAGEARAESWVRELGVEKRVELLESRPHAEMGELLRSAAVMVSPSTHDGTPNTLLEAMACGCFPIVGDVASLREWIQPGVNGMIIDAGDPRGLAKGILEAFRDNELRARASQENSRLVAERADFSTCMRQAETFYRQVIKGE